MLASHSKRPAVLLYTQGFNTGSDFLGKLDSALLTTGGQDYAEFIATKTCHRVRLAHGLREQVR